MLVLTRRAGEVIRINDDIEIVVIKIIGNAVQIGIAAPQDIKILRAELKDNGYNRVEKISIPIRIKQKHKKLKYNSDKAPTLNEVIAENYNPDYPL
jgi:carbon storage regulator